MPPDRTCMLQGIDIAVHYKEEVPWIKEKS